ncbi:MAG: amino acid adenylation domain-containing protein, partial [Chloroflexota bacterium]
MQRGMLFHSISAPDSGVDVQHVSMTLNEPINLNKFRTAWESVTKRYETLRASFLWEGRRHTVSIIEPQVSLPITEVDWSQLTKDQQVEQYQSLVEIDRLQGFKLDKPPLMRVTVIRISENTTWCLWSFHHIILDGRSFPLVLKEVFVVYDALLDGKAVNLKNSFPFSDYVKISEAYDHSKSEKYWKELLEGFSSPTPLGLAFSKQKTPVASAAKNSVTFLSDHAAQKLNAFARDIGVTLNTLIQGAWGLLLHHYTAQNDVVFGNTRSGRYLYEPAKSSVGMFINTVPVRVKIDSSQSLVEYLRELRAQHISVREHESTPLPQIQKWSEVDTSEPLFNTLVAFENYELSNVLRRNGGKWLKRKFHYQGQTSFPLTLMAYSDNQIRLRLEYDPQIYKKETVGQILEHLKTMLQGMVERPYSPAVSIPYLTDAEVNFLVSKLNPRVSTIGLEETIYETFSRVATKNPSKIALIDESRSITYRELTDRSNQLAHYLRSLGAKANSPIGVCMHRGIDLAISLLASLASGGAYLPLDPDFPKERLSLMVQDSGAEIVITSGDLESLFSEFSGRKVDLEIDREDIFRQPITTPSTVSRMDDLAYMIYTSGSTGKPKGVQVPHRAVSNFMLTMEARPGITAEDTLLAVTTISFDISVLELFLPLVVGGKVVLASKDSTIDGHSLNSLMEEHDVTVMQATPATWRLLLDSGWEGREGLKILCGGESLSKELAAELIQRGDSLWNMYGPTETTIWSLVSNITESKIESDQPIPIGRPIANTTVFILNKSDQLVAIGAPGELCIGGQGVSLGYINLENLTKEKYFQAPFAKGLLYRTGDIAKYTTRGDVQFLGRIDNQLKIRGFRVEPNEIEDAILSHESVKQAIVVSHASKTGENRLVGYVVPEPDSTTDVSQLRDYVSTYLPDYMIPSAWLIMDSMPRLANGKIDRRQLPEPDGSRPELKNPYVAPKTKLEKDIASIWIGVLNVNNPGIHDNFFDLGGDSLSVVRVLSHLRNQLNAELNVADLYSLRTIQSISEKLNRTQNEPAEIITSQVQKDEIEEEVVNLKSGSDLEADDGFDFVLMGGAEAVDKIELAQPEEESVQSRGDNEALNTARKSIDDLVTFDSWDWDDLDSEDDQVSVVVHKHVGHKTDFNEDFVRPNTESRTTEHILDSPLSSPQAPKEDNQAFPIDFSGQGSSSPEKAEGLHKHDDKDKTAETTGELFEFDFDDLNFDESVEETSKKAKPVDEKGPLLPETFSLDDVYYLQDAAGSDQAINDSTNKESASPPIDQLDLVSLSDGSRSNQSSDLVESTIADSKSDDASQQEAGAIQTFDFEIFDDQPENGDAEELTTFKLGSVDDANEKNAADELETFTIFAGEDKQETSIEPNGVIIEKDDEAIQSSSIQNESEEEVENPLSEFESYDLDFSGDQNIDGEDRSSQETNALQTPNDQILDDNPEESTVDANSTSGRSLDEEAEANELVNFAISKGEDIQESQSESFADVEIEKSVEESGLSTPNELESFDLDFADDSEA